MDRFTLPGYDVEALLGFGGSGEVWRARDLTTGEVVALKRLHGDGGATANGVADRRLHREAALLASVRHEHVVRLRSVVPSADGLVLVLDYASGGSLASVLAVRNQLSPGEVVTIGAPLAQALADAHSRGLIHGDVTPANVVFDDSGKPLLADLGVARLVGEVATTIGMTKGFTDPAVLAGGQVTPASDLYGLAAVCFVALTGGAPGSGVEIRGHGIAPALVVAIESALDADPRARPDGMAFARALYGSCTAEPVRLARGDGGRSSRIESTHHAPAVRVEPADERAHRRRGSAGGVLAGRHRLQRLTGPAVVRRLVLPIAAVALLGLAVAVGVGWASHDRSAAASVSPAPASMPGSTPGSTPGSIPGSMLGSAPASPGASGIATADASWQRVLAALDTLRDDAFADLDADELDSVYVATSPALGLDRSTLADLAAAGEHARGLTLRLTSVSVRSQDATQVVLAVRDVLPGYDLVQADGTAIHQSGRGEQSWVVTLARASADRPWRIDTIDPG